MTPFDLEAAKRGAPITCDGTEVFFIGTDSKGNIVIECNGSISTSLRCYLYMAPVKRTVWVNVYKKHGVACHYDTQAEADKQACSDRIGGKAWPLEIEE
jgi:hypothetical protein